MVFSIIIIILLIAADRASKILFAAYLSGKEMVTLIPNVLGLELLHGGNTGAAFGMFSGNTFFLVVVTGIVLAGLLYCLLIKKFNSKLLNAAVMLIIAGGIGNLYDRIAFGSVTDFFVFLFTEFAVFNVADCFICIGAGLAILYLILSKKDEPIFKQSTCS